MTEIQRQMKKGDLTKVYHTIVHDQALKARAPAAPRGEINADLGIDLRGRVLPWSDALLGDSSIKRKAARTTWELVGSSVRSHSLLRPR